MYKIVGGDQREYGPVTSEQIRQWISDGRANAQTLASFEGSPWKPLSTFPEFADALRASAPPALPQAAPGLPGQTFPVAKSNGLAVTGLVLAALGLCCSPLALVGFILSIVAFVQINQNPQAYTTSKAVPIIGMVLGFLSIMGTIVFVSSGRFEEIMRNLPR